MSTSADFEIRQIFASVPSQMRDAEELLRSAGLRPERLPYFIGAYDAGGVLAGVGGLDDGIIKCVAVRPEARGTSITNKIVSHLMSKAQEDGHTNIFVFTKPEYATVFTSLSFHLVGQAAGAILLESDPRGIKHYASYLQSLPRGERNGVIVMNCNPLTLGHLHLIRQAASEVDCLFIIPVMEDKSLFSYTERCQMLSKATERISNATVCKGSRYSISSATFPTYFLKELSTAAATQIELDCDIFSRHIIPALNASVRFVGTEPADALTQQYNLLMPRLLPIEVKTVERLCDNDGTPISASRVRKAIAAGEASDVYNLIPEATLPYVLAEAASTALTQELELTPKPGLVDLHDNGAHTDMNAALMRRSIAALRPWFGQMAEAACKPDSTENVVSIIHQLGQAAEKAMLETTRGVNTHKGALFCMGMTIAAAARCYKDCGITTAALKEETKALATLFTQPEATHGSIVTKKFGVGGALAAAQSGYEQLFASWLPFLKENIDKEEVLHLLLLKIMSELDDTNIYHRCGAETAESVKREAAAMLEDFSLEAIADLNRRYISQNISPGGAADMLALTLLINSITK